MMSPTAIHLRTNTTSPSATDTRSQTANGTAPAAGEGVCAVEVSPHAIKKISAPAVDFAAVYRAQVPAGQEEGVLAQRYAEIGKQAAAVAAARFAKANARSFEANAPNSSLTPVAAAVATVVNGDAVAAPAATARAQAAISRAEAQAVARIAAESITASIDAVSCSLDAMDTTDATPGNVHVAIARSAEPQTVENLHQLAAGLVKPLNVMVSQALVAHPAAIPGLAESAEVSSTVSPAAARVMMISGVWGSKR